MMLPFRDFARASACALVLVVTSTLPFALAQQTSRTIPSTTAGDPDLAAPLGFDRLLELVDQAPDVVAAETRLDTARFDLEVAGRPFDATLTATAERDVDLFGDSGGASLVAGASATFSVLPYGPAADALERAENAVVRSRLQLERVRGETLLRALDAFTTALRGGQEIDVRARERTLAEARLDAVRQQRSAGAANDAQVVQAKIALATAENDLAAAERAARTALTALSQTLGTAVTSVEGAVPAAPNLESVDAAQRIPERADVVGARLDVAEAELALDAVRREANPSAAFDVTYRGSGGDVDVRAGAEFDTRTWQPTVSAGAGFDSGGGADSSRLTFGATLSVPIDPAGGAEREAAELAVARAEVQLDRTRSAAAAEIENLRRALEGAAAQVDLTARLVTQREAALADAQVQNELGLLSLLDVQQAEVALLEAQLQHDRAEDAGLRTTLELAAALALEPWAASP